MASSSYWMALIMLALTAAVAACPRHNETRMGRYNQKRWYGIQSWPDTEYGQPWPTDSKGRTQVRYCYETQESFDVLNDLIARAVKFWEPAMAVSTLDIFPYGQVPSLAICTSNIPIDVVRISAATDRQCRASLGYFAKPNRNVISCDLRALGRNGLPHKRMSLAHEIGHVLGLHHEHQRPDAHDYIEFRCDQVQGYNDLVQMIVEKRQPMYQDGDTIIKVCTDMVTARRYGAITVELIPDPYWPSTTLDSRGRSKAFDYDSIMLYDSFAAAEDPVTLPDGSPDLDSAPMVGRTLDDLDNVWELVPAGVTRDPVTQFMDYRLAKISQGDIARIEQLYPRPGQASGLQSMEKWQMEP